MGGLLKDATPEISGVTRVNGEGRRSREGSNKPILADFGLGRWWRATVSGCPRGLGGSVLVDSHETQHREAWVELAPAVCIQPEDCDS